MKYDLTGKVALITGASRGIGRAVAIEYARAGAHVLLLARTAHDLESLDDEIRGFGGTCTLIRQDLAEIDKLPSLAPLISSRFARLDILVLNAAMLGDLMPLAHMEVTMWQQLLQVNLTANFVLLQTLDPLLRAAPSGRVIAVTSGVTKVNLPFWGGYSVCKAALEKLILTYGAEVEHTNVRVELLSPGAVATKMRAQAMPGEDPTALPQPSDVAGRFVELAI